MRIYLKARILPAFGRMPLDRIGPGHVAAWFDAASKDKPGAANRAFEILRSMMFRAEEWGLLERNSNPCLGIARNPAKRVARFLDAGELARLGRALDRPVIRFWQALAGSTTSAPAQKSIVQAPQGRGRSPPLAFPRAFPVHSSAPSSSRPVRFQCPDHFLKRFDAPLCLFHPESG